MSHIKRLDRSRDFGQVFPPDKHPTVEGAVKHFEQDGFPFDHEGKLVEAFLTPEQLAELDGTGKQPAKAAKEKKAKAEPSTRVEKRASDAAKDKSGEELNLTAWLQGDVKYQEFRVKKVVRDRYSRKFANIGDLVEFLVTDQSLVPKEKLAPEFVAMLTPAKD